MKRRTAQISRNTKPREENTKPRDTKPRDTKPRDRSHIERGIGGTRNRRDRYVSSGSFNLYYTFIICCVELPPTSCVFRESNLRATVFTTASPESLRAASSSPFTTGARSRAEKLIALMRRLEAFSGVRVLDYVIMANHFHLVCEVPEPRALSQSEVLERIEALYGPARVRALEKQLARFSEQPDGARAVSTACWNPFASG